MMPYFKLLLGAMFCFLGFCYIYKPRIIERINDIVKDTLFNNSYISLIRIKAAILFLLMGVLLLYMGFSSLFFN